MRHRIFILFALLTGCDFTPEHRPGMWEATGVNERNIQAMLANPADYYHGTGSSGADGTAAATAVERYRTDKLKPLRQASGQSFQPGGGGSSSSTSQETSGGN